MRPGNSHPAASSGPQSMEPGLEACGSCHRQYGPPAGLAQSAGNSAICQDCAEGEAEPLCPIPDSPPGCSACAAPLCLTRMSATERLVKASYVNTQPAWHVHLQARTTILLGPCHFYGSMSECLLVAADDQAQQDAVLNSLSDPSHSLPVSHGEPKPGSNSLSMHFSLNLGSDVMSAAGGGFHPPDSTATDDVPEI